MSSNNEKENEVKFNPEDAYEGNKYFNAITSMASIETNHKLNGSYEGRETPIVSKIPEKDKSTGTDIDFKMAGEEVSPLAFISPLAYKLICHLYDKRITKKMIRSMDKNLRVTKGMFMIKYVPTTDKYYRKGRPFKFGQDLIRMRIYVSGPKEWHALCDKIPELDWIRRNSTFSDTMFTIAKEHPGMSFWFSLDWVRYYNMLKEQPLVTEEDKNIHAFGAYKCSAEEYRKHYKDKTATLRVLNDVLKEVQEVEKSPAVQEEMLNATGETGMTRDIEPMPKDPKTGRFISKKKREE